MEQLTFGEEPAEAGIVGRNRRYSDGSGLRSPAPVPAPAPPWTGYEIERELADAGMPCVAGVDEVGRGAWAGPVVVCAVVVRPGFPEAPPGLTDSKRVTPRRRAALAADLPDWVADHALGEASHEEIDALGMTAALRKAAVRALDRLTVAPDVVLLDGSHDYIGSPRRVRCVVKADLRSVSVAAASVIAKVSRDRAMAGLGTEHPDFGFGDNAGYPSPVHTEALARLGPTPYHRLSWSYLDDLPRWRHLKKPRPGIEGQLSLI